MPITHILVTVIDRNIEITPCPSYDIAFIHMKSQFFNTPNIDELKEIDNAALDDYSAYATTPDYNYDWHIFEIKSKETHHA